MLFLQTQMVHLAFQGCEHDLYLSSGSILLVNMKSGGSSFALDV